MSKLKEKILNKSAVLGVCGLGYVGLPLAVEKAKAGFTVIGFDVQEEKVKLDWPPLESDPLIFNDYFHSLGLKKDVYFKEMLSLVDYSAFLSINGPLLGVILNYS